VSQPLTLTFAEIEFVLAARPQQAAEVRRDLRIDQAQSDPALVRAGLASLLVRGLCEPAETPVEGAPNVKPGPEITAVAAALSTSRRHTVAAGWCGPRAEVMHVYSGGDVRLALFPYQYGRFAVTALDPAEPMSGPLSRFLDAHLADDLESVLIVRSTAGEETVSMAVAVDAAGSWSASDSLQNPDHAEPTTREQVLPRMAELFDGASAVAAS
jgi:hypothetical protein